MLVGVMCQALASRMYLLLLVCTHVNYIQTWCIYFNIIYVYKLNIDLFDVIDGRVIYRKASWQLTNKNKNVYTRTPLQ